MPDISIITPSFNQHLFLKRTIDSVLQNQHLDIEHIVMDAESTDGSINILKAYSDKVRWFSEKDNGQAHAVNKAIKLANADIIGWLNSDDIYYPGTLTLIHAFFNDHPEINIVYGQAHFIDENDTIIGCYPTRPFNLKALTHICFICQPAVFFRKTIIDTYGYLDENLHFCMDYEYWLRIAHTGEVFAYLPSHVLAASRIHPKSKTCSQQKHAASELVTMLSKRNSVVSGVYLINLAWHENESHHVFNIISQAIRKSIQYNGFIQGIKAVFFTTVVYQRIFKKMASHINFRRFLRHQKQ